MKIVSVCQFFCVRDGNLSESLEKLGESAKRRYLQFFRISILEGIGRRAMGLMSIIQVIDRHFKNITQNMTLCSFLNSLLKIHHLFTIAPLL